MQTVRVTFHYNAGAAVDFGPFTTDEEALSFIKTAKENKDVRSAFRSDIAPPETLIDFLPTD